MTKNRLSVAILLFAAAITANLGTLSAESAPVDAFGDPLPPGAIARMGTTRLRHGSQVYTVAFSPDGKLIASGSAHGELRLWDAVTGKLVQRMVDTSGTVFRVIAFSPDGKLLASDKGGTFGLWQVSTGNKLRDLEGGGGAASAAFSPDGKELAVGNEYGGDIQIFDPATGKPSRKIIGHDKAGVVVVYSHDGKLLASAGQDKTARIWDAATGKELHRFQEPAPVFEAVLSPDGKLLATRTARAVRLWDVASGKEVRRFDDDCNQLRCLAFSPDGKIVCSCGVLWNVATGKEVCRCKGTLQGGMALSPDGKTIAAGGLDGVVYLFDAGAGRELPVSRAGWNRGSQKAVGFTTDDKELVLRAENGGGIHLCETATGKEIRQYATDKQYPHAVALSPDGKLLAAGTDSGTLFLWETATGQCLSQLKAPGKKRYDVRQWALAFAPDGRTLAAAAGENVIRLWDVATGKELQQCRGHEGDIWSLFFMSSGKTLVSTGKDETTRFWDVTDGKERSGRLKQTDYISAVSADGRLIAVNDFKGDKAFHIQEVATGREVRRFPAGYAGYCAFSADGKSLAVSENSYYTPDKEKALLLLEVATGKVRAKFAGHQGMDSAQMAFSSDGRMLASGGGDTTALVWDATGRMRGGRFEIVALSPKELRDSWAALAGDDAAEAYRAIWALTASPEQTLPLLKEYLRPLPAADPKETARRLADLDSDDFSVREKAEKELGEQGDLVEPALRKKLDEQPSAEVRQRVERLLQKFDSRSLQGFRAIEVLERIGTSEAEKVLKEVAHGAPAARLTQDAKASLDRLSRKPAP